VVVTDAMNMAAITDYYDSVEGTILAINAGADMICMPCDLSDMEDVQTLDGIIDSIEHAVEEGAISHSRIHDAVTRILTMKEKRGILDYDEKNHTLEKALATVGCDANRALEREMAAASVTVIKNNGNFLPIKLKNDSKVLMLCPFDNEKALMLMGWNRAKLAKVVPEQASVDYYHYTGVNLTSEIKSRIDAADMIIVVSEVTSPDRMGYAHWLSAAPNNFTTYAKENGKRSVIISADKPYDVQHYPNADAILAVYGCKGTTLSASTVLEDKLTEDKNAFGPNIVAGIEVAFGVYGAQGKLPLDIPYCDNGVYSKTEIIYQRGYGITYDAVHFHSYDKTYRYDNNSHFYECIDPECPDKVGSRTDIDFHEYSSYLDKVCDVCGYNLGGGVGSGGIFKWILIGAATIVFGFAMYGGYKVWKRFY